MKVGDKVAVIDDTITGIVMKMEDKKVFIESADGFPFEFDRNELVVISENQFVLSRYSDVLNEDMLKKEIDFPKKKQKVVKKSKQPPMEVDLHIHQLTKSIRNMDSHDILTLQLDVAKRKIEFAIQNKISRIVFIHGVGEGILKTELEYLLKRYKVDFYAASFQKYGLGATEVYVYQKQ